MALTVPQYVEQMRLRQETLARRLGVDLRGVPQEVRVVLTCANAMTAIAFRRLSLALVVTDGQLAAEFDAAMAAVFGAEPPPGPNTDPDPTSTAKA